MLDAADRGRSRKYRGGIILAVRIAARIFAGPSTGGEEQCRGCAQSARRSSSNLYVFQVVVEVHDSENGLHGIAAVQL